MKHKHRNILIAFLILVCVVPVVAGTIFIISVQQSKRIVALIEEKDYENLEKACSSAVFIDRVPVFSHFMCCLAEIQVWTPLQEACIHSDTTAVRILLENGADPNATQPFHGQWDPPIVLAAGVGNVQIMQLLLEHGAEPNKYGQEILTRLTRAARYGQYDHSITLNDYKIAYELLASQGITADLDDFDERPLLCESALLSDLEVTDYLVSEKGLSPLVICADGRTLLHYCCLSGWTDPTPEYVSYLLEKGVDWTLRDSKGKTAYDYAVEGKHEEIAQMLKALEN
jgi:ankyrin repeat protein